MEGSRPQGRDAKSQRAEGVKGEISCPSNLQGKQSHEPHPMEASSMKKEGLKGSLCNKARCLRGEAQHGCVDGSSEALLKEIQRGRQVNSHSKSIFEGSLHGQRDTEGKGEDAQIYSPV